MSSTKAHPIYDDTDGVQEWIMKLYVTDWNPRCVLAYKNLNRICSQNLKDRCHIEVIDLLETPGAAKRDQIVAIPTLVKTSPGPQKTMIGDFANEAKVLNMLGLESIKP